MMKRMIKSLGAVALYLAMLCFLLKTETVLLFSPEHIGMFLLGCVILCIPHMEKGLKVREMREIFRRNAITAGYLEAFMLLFGSLNRGDVPQNRIMTELALDMRPLFYGFVCYAVLGNKEESETKTEPMEDSVEETGSGPRRENLLTRQERNVAKLAQRGLTNREIGEELCISEATVKKHMSNIFEKLGIGSRRELK